MARSLLQLLVGLISRVQEEVGRFLARRKRQTRRPPVPATVQYLPLERVLLTDGVSRSVFETYAGHYASPRGDEETGWMLLGYRGLCEAVVVATLPAGTKRSAGVGHIQFDSSGQAVASRFVRQIDRRVNVLGVLHTHPGSLRHPTSGDFQGDRYWVRHLRGKEGVFGIGTADAASMNGQVVAQQPRPNVQCWGKFRFTWYSLAENDAEYRALPVALTLGPDLARPLHSVWSVIEAHADALDRLCRQQSNVSFEVVDGVQEPRLRLTFRLVESQTEIHVHLEGKNVEYYVLQNGEVFAVEPNEPRIDRAVSLLLAELAAETA
jgi:hypothetical protein